MPAPTLRNILLDRDGTIIEERHYLHDPEAVTLVAGGGEALGRLTRAGMRLFCVTNQSGIGRGYYGPKDFEAVQSRLQSLLSPFETRISDTAFCPHAPQEGCACRKPAIGLFAALAAKHYLTAAETAVIGDTASDIAFGLALGAAVTILVETGHGARDARQLGLPDLDAPFLVLTTRAPGWPHVLARDLPAAVDFLLTQHLATSGRP